MGGISERARLVKCWSWALLVCLLLFTSGEAKMTEQQLKEMEAINMKNMLKQEIRMAAKQDRKQGPRIIHEETTPEQNYSHPYHKPGIVNDVRYSYRKYREMLLVKGGKCWIGTNDPNSRTGEYPMKQVPVKSFYLDKNPVINALYWVFRAQKKFVRSEAEKKGWSWVVDMFLSDETREYYSMPGSRGWAAVKRAIWDAPEGADSTLEGRWKHPVVHLSWTDAKAYCEFQGKRLPTEPEWEMAARGGLTNRAYPWGDNWERQRANVWQGEWPYENKRADGYSMTSPVDAFHPQNLIGFYDMIGNVWEWTSSPYVETQVQQHLQPKMAVLKGGSYVDSVNGRVNYEVRNGQRTGQKLDYTAANVGFRCARSAPEVDLEMEKTTSTTTTPAQRRKGRMFHRRRKDEL